jgi:hypothetical protein
MFFRRGIMFMHEAVREREMKLAMLLSATLGKRRHGALDEGWYVDETYVKVGRWRLTGASTMCTHRLWREAGIVAFLAMTSVWAGRSPAADLRRGLSAHP